MNVEELLRASLREAAEAGGTAPHDFADRVLRARRRRRTRTIAGAAAATALVVTTVVAVPRLDASDSARLASEKDRSSVIAHPDQSPPRDLIAAGNAALAGFYTTEKTKQPNGDELFTRTYGLLDQETGTYEKASEWAWVDVAPGMRTAAVLEGELPAQRIGILDLLTGEVDRWIPVDRPVAGVEWSPDGSRLVATAYSKNPDRRIDLPDDHPKNGPQEHGSRTGFFIIDADSGAVGPFRELPQRPADEFGLFHGNSRADLRWSHDGTLLYLQQPGGGGKIPEWPPSTEPDERAESERVPQESRAWYTPDGHKTEAPAGERYAGHPEAGLSPDGKLLAGGFAYDGDEISSEILAPATGKRVTTVPGQQLLAWADDKRLIAWGCAPRKCDGKNEFRNQLMLVTVGSDEVVPLSDFRKASDDYPGRWSPLFSER